MSGPGNRVMLVLGVAVLHAVSAFIGNAFLRFMYISCGCQVLCCSVFLAQRYPDDDDDDGELFPRDARCIYDTYIVK